MNKMLVRINMNHQQEIITAIKSKKELLALDSTLILDRVEKVLLQDKKIREKIEKSKSFKELSRSTMFKEFVKEIRSELRSIYGVFDLDEKKEKKKLLKKIKEKPEEHLIEKLLLLHQSSKERFHSYKEIYEKLFEITGKPSSILDLACGYNPYSYDYLECSSLYVAVDLPSDDLKDITEFFLVKGIEGEVLGVDLVRDYEKIGKLTEENPFDVVFLFKALDSLESVKRHISGKLLDCINAKWIIASFPTMSLGGKKHIPKERRTWFEKLLKRREWYFETMEVGDEVFYVVLRDPERLAKEFYESKGKEMTAHFDSFDMSKTLDKFCKELPGKKVIDLGSGSGRDVEYFVKKGLDTVGIDYSQKLLSIAKKRVPKAKFILADMKNLPIEKGQVDGVWACAVLVHCYKNNAKKTLEECRRVLKKGGTLFIGVKIGKSEIQTRHGEKVFMKKWKIAKLHKMLHEVGFEVVVSDVFDKRTFDGSQEGHAEIICRAV